MLLVAADGVRVVDAADPFAPRSLGGILEIGSGAAVADGLVYVAAGASGLRIFELGPEYARAIPVELRIGSGAGRGPVNAESRGVLNVALLGSADLDPSDVALATLRFGPGQAPVAPVPPGRQQDLDGDGFPDLLLHFRTVQTGLAADPAEACVRGETLSGRRLAGCVAPRTVPPPRPLPRIQLPPAAVRLRARR